MSNHHQKTGGRLKLLRERPGWTLGLFLTVLLAGWTLWTILAPAPPPPPPAAPPEAKAKMESLTLSEIQEGDKKWVLNATQADYRKGRDEIHLQGVNVEFYHSAQEVIYLRAKEGLVNTKTRGLVLTGQVELEKGDITIKTELARYLPLERALVAPENVVMEGPRARVEGKDLYIDLVKKRLILKQHRLTELTLEKGLMR
jgi:LPS export ABC transporter protein LptC